MPPAVSRSSEQSERFHDEAGLAEEAGGGRITDAIEQRAAQVPSNALLWAAGASIGGSLLLHMMDRKQDARFVGQWAPTLLCLGIYNEMTRRNATAHRY